MLEALVHYPVVRMNATEAWEVISTCSPTIRPAEDKSDQAWHERRPTR